MDAVARCGVQLNTNGTHVSACGADGLSVLVPHSRASQAARRAVRGQHVCTLLYRAMGIVDRACDFLHGHVASEIQHTVLLGAPHADPEREGRLDIVLLPRCSQATASRNC